MRRSLLAAGLALGVAVPASPALANIRTGVSERPRLDVRTAAPTVAPLASVSAAATRLRTSFDASTGLPRVVARDGGFLTGPSSASAPSIARSYLSTHAALFGTSAAAITTLVQTRDVVDAAGLHQVSLAQRIDGVPVFQGGVKVNVGPDGQVVSVVGSPVPATATSVDPTVSAGEALGIALRDGGGSLLPSASSTASTATRDTTFASRPYDRASLVWFDAGHGPQLAWHTYAEVDSQHVYEDVIDASSGALLFRENAVDFAGKGLHWWYLPSYSASFPLNNGGMTASYTQPTSDDFVALGWLEAGAPRLSGNNAHVYADYDDQDTPTEVAPGGGGGGLGAGDWASTFLPSSGYYCTVTTPCSWDSNRLNTFQTNMPQDATQVFFFVNEFHDHLAAAPIGFTAAKGNFEGVDAVDAQVDDGADVAGGFPDSNHINNANMYTPADGTPPRMQMYLFTNWSGREPFVDGNGGDDASIVYHEYTHGLTSRLVTDASGDPALQGQQPGSMGEAWSDWYALDFIVKGCTDATPLPTDCWDADLGPNAAGSANLWLGRGVAGGPNRGVRTQPIDCLVNDGGGVSPIAGENDGPVCPGGDTGRVGGYTYADFGKIIGAPEVHADGEIWGETLWQIRQAIGPASYQVTENIVTRALELSPPEPTFLDERNAILQADQVLYGGAHAATLWSVFAQRGMGYSASTTGPNDTAPRAAFDLPQSAPTSNPAPPAPPTSTPPSTPTTTAGPSTPPPPPPLDTTAPTVSQRVSANQSLRTILSSGLKLWFSCSEACTVRDTLKLSASQARKLKLGRKAIVLGAGVEVLAKKGSTVVPVKLTLRGKSLVRGHRSLAVTSSATVLDTNGNTRTSTRVFTLRHP